MIRKFCCLTTFRSLSPQRLLNIFTELFRWVAWHPIERGFPPLLFQISFLFLLYQYVKELNVNKKINNIYFCYNYNIELNFNISNFCKKNFKKFLHQFVGSPGLEPRTQGPKSCVLPLHHDPIYKKIQYYSSIMFI